VYRGRNYGNKVTVLCNRLCWLRTETKTGFSCCHNRSNACLQTLPEVTRLLYLLSLLQNSVERTVGDEETSILVTSKFVYLCIRYFVLLFNIFVLFSHVPLSSL